MISKRPANANLEEYMTFCRDMYSHRSALICLVFYAGHTGTYWIICIGFKRVCVTYRIDGWLRELRGAVVEQTR